MDAVSERLVADLDPEERLLYDRCTVCHSPRVPEHYTQLQWKGILPSMFERAGVDDVDKAAITAYLLAHASDTDK